jgi:GNAT superfamily N-acetyltransferase
MTHDLATDANENLRRAFVTLAEEAPLGEARQFGPLAAASVGLPVPFYNRVFIFESPPADELSAAVAWMSERNVPFWVTVTEPVVEAIKEHLADLNLVKATEQPGMAMASLDEIPPRNSAADIAEVTDPDELDDFNRVAASVFRTPLDVAEQVYQVALVGDEKRLFLGRVNGYPAACGLLIQSGDVAGVYTIGVSEEFRRQGIGEVMSWEVLRAGREAGCHVGVLQSSDMAYPLYKKMGFETVVTYHHFESGD